MAAAPLISVIVPTRNRPLMLEQTLRAIQEQTFSDCEVVVMDDGSAQDVRDAYPRLWERLDERFRLILIGPAGHPGSGPSKARNLGIKACRGLFLTFCDDDDHWCAPDHLAIAAQALATRPWARMYVANQTGMQGGAVLIADWLPEVSAGLAGWLRLPGLPVYEVPQAALIESSAFPHLNILLVHRDMVAVVNGFWEEAFYEEDRDFFWRCLDGVETVLFRPDIVSLHNIPDSLVQNNVSTQATQEERWAGRELVCRHIAVVCQNPALVARACRQQADTLRHFATALETRGRNYLAFRFALSSLLARFSSKWLLYTVYLLARSPLRRTREQTNMVTAPRPDSAGSPLFSIIVPTRNRPEMTEKALRAILAQSFRDFEVIIIDDGSSETVRAAYPALWEKLDDRFRLIPLGPPDHSGSGPSRARNAGIAAARGRFLTFCDDDDCWCGTDHLAAAAGALAAMPEARMYVGNQVGRRDGVDHIADWLPDLTARLPNRPRLRNSDVRMVSRSDLIASRAFPHMNILVVHRDIVAAIGGFWVRAPYEGDLEFFWRCLDRVDTVLFRPAIISIHNIPDPDRQDNVSTRCSQMERWLLRATNCRHVLTSIGNPALIRRVLALEGYTLRHLTQYLARSGRDSATLKMSLQALAGHFSAKWLAYILLLIGRKLYGP